MNAVRHPDMKSKIALVSTPFVSIFTPSLQLGLIKAICAKVDISLDDIYLSVDFAKRIGTRFYNCVTFVPNPQIGEWLFSDIAFGKAENSEAYLAKLDEYLVPFYETSGQSPMSLRRLRKGLVQEFVHDSVERLKHYEVVAFSSTFQQDVCSLAVAREVKAANPDVKIVFGGSNVHGPMGDAHFKAFEWLDVVVTGEADHFLAQMFSSLLSEEEFYVDQGIISRLPFMGSRKAGYPVYRGRMDELPVPDYGSYFEAMGSAGFLEGDLGYPISMPFESSRGCWWGEKHHCKFCGLNSIGMAYRPKSPAKVKAELTQLASTYDCNRFDATDNIIPRKESAELLEALRAVGDLDIFYEIKANIGREDARALAEAGIRRVQPGIESLSTNLLRLMNKGTTSLQNINALRWLGMFGVEAHWNIIHGFPGERIEDFERQTDLVPKLTHLPPPTGVSRIRVDRFSPYFEDEEQRRLFTNVEPLESYRYIYPSDSDMGNLAYHFAANARESVADRHLQPLFDRISHWQNAWGRLDDITPFKPTTATLPSLRLEDRGSQGSVIVDGRSRPDSPERIALDPIDTAILMALFDKPVGLPLLHDRMRLAYDISRQRLESSLRWLDENGLVIGEDDLVLALPTIAYREIARPQSVAGLKDDTTHIQETMLTPA